MPVNPPDIENCKKLMKAWEGGFIKNPQGKNAQFVGKRPTKLLHTWESDMALVAIYLGDDENEAGGIRIDMYDNNLKQLCQSLAEKHGSTSSVECGDLKIRFRFYPCKSMR